MSNKFIDVKGYEGFYKINVKGDLYSIRGDKLKSWHTDSDGFVGTNLYKNKKMKHVKQHRLIAEHFLPNKKKLPEIKHLDGNHSNNSLQNLKWVKRYENKRRQDLDNIPICQYQAVDKRNGNISTNYEAQIIIYKDDVKIRLRKKSRDREIVQNWLNETKEQLRMQQQDFNIV
jgi:hypothetical protein